MVLGCSGMGPALAGTDCPLGSKAVQGFSQTPMSLGFAALLNPHLLVRTEKPHGTVKDRWTDGCRWFVFTITS